MKSTRLKGSTLDAKKNIQLSKCFICNQIFYEQGIYDTHMKNHKAKLEKSQPEEIERKTLQSFRKNPTDPKRVLPGKNNKLEKIDMLKKNKVGEKRIVTAKPLKAPEESIKMMVSGVVAKTIRVKTEQEKDSDAQDQQFLDYQSECRNNNQQGSFMTEIGTPKEELQNKNSQNSSIQADSKDEAISFEKVYSFTALGDILKEKRSLEDMGLILVRTDFGGKREFVNYQSQLEYLYELTSVFKVKTKAQFKPDGNKIQKTILKISEQMLLEMNNYNNVGKQQRLGKQSQQTITRCIAEQMQICSECCGQIFSQECFSLSCGHYYHLDCWEETEKCCGV